LIYRNLYAAICWRNLICQNYQALTMTNGTCCTDILRNFIYQISVLQFAEGIWSANIIRLLLTEETCPTKSVCWSLLKELDLPISSELFQRPAAY
jgi:hypothetical protein